MRPQFIRDAGIIDGRRHAVYQCPACESHFTWARTRIDNAYKADCGCESTNRRREAHSGLKSSHPSEYRCWSAMKVRCLVPTSKDWRRYGGAGVNLHTEWAESFAAFLSHIGPRPSANHSIDRIDTRRGYEPGNVRWATRVEQQRNRRNSYVYTVQDGVFATLAEAADFFMVKEATIGKWVNGYNDKRGRRVPPRPDCSRSRIYA